MGVRFEVLGGADVVVDVGSSGLKQLEFPYVADKITLFLLEPIESFQVKSLWRDENHAEEDFELVGDVFVSDGYADEGGEVEEE